MKDYDFIAKSLREGMYQSNMHTCLRDIGALAGGYLAAGRISAIECDSLMEIAKSLAINKQQAEKEWKKAIVYGTRSPIAAHEEYVSNEELTFETRINSDDFKIVDENWLEREAVIEPTAKWNPCEELSKYINLLFKPDEFIEFCVDPTNVGTEDAPKWVPINCVYTLKAKDILKHLKKGKFEEAVGTVTQPDVGAWIRINPFDGKGIKDENVTDFRHVLIECDSKPIEDQIAIYKKLELPCACIVNSGGKSAHAIVRIDASDIDEYRKRVDFLYSVCTKNGLPLDKQNRNPSRYSRMPGVMRGERKQYIMCEGIGKPSWDEWENWVNDLNDNLPDFETLCDFNNPPPLKRPLIDGLLREGDKMRVAGPSKAGKSFALIELAIAVAEGREWMGFKCAQGRVLYIDLELNPSSCNNRFVDIYKALGWRPDHWDMISAWHLRGKAMPLDKLAPKLVRRAKDQGFSMIILDPIYKVLTGDENSASDMGVFCNQLDYIASECGCAMVDCHHHSKGAQGDKRSMDRASGSGVFARDPDALVDFIQLNTNNAESQLKRKMETEAIISELGTHYNDLVIAPDASPDELFSVASKYLEHDVMERVRSARAQILDGFCATGWRLSFTVRDFRTPKDMNVWFKYPIHLPDDGLLANSVADGERPKGKSNERTHAEKMGRLEQAINIIGMAGPEGISCGEVAEQLGISANTLHNNYLAGRKDITRRRGRYYYTKKDDCDED